MREDPQLGLSRLQGREGMAQPVVCIPGLVTLAVLIAGLALSLALGSPETAQACVEDMPCWIPAMDGNAQGSLDIFHPFAR